MDGDTKKGCQKPAVHQKTTDGVVKLQTQEKCHHKAHAATSKSGVTF